MVFKRLLVMVFLPRGICLSRLAVGLVAVIVSRHDAAAADFLQAWGFVSASRGLQKHQKNQGLDAAPGGCAFRALPNEIRGQGVFHKVSLFIASPVAIDGLRAHSESKSVVPVCRPPLTGRVVF
jgi:hypothetical protein